MKEDYIKYLTCPICGLDLRLIETSREDDRIKEGFLLCKNHIFNITNFIPRLLPKIDNKDQISTIKSFADKWANNKKYAIKVADFQQKWYLKRYGFNKKTFKSFMNKQKFILEAGCGVGKDTSFFASNTQGLIFAIDISPSIDTAQKNNKYNNVCFIQADITKLPFKNEFFDFISCDQVLHHTPKPAETLNHLLSKLKKKGILVSYVYKVKSVIREFTDEHIRKKGVTMSYKDCYNLCKPLTLLGRELSKIKTKVNVPDISILNIKGGRYNIQRFIYYNIFKCFWNDDFDFDTNMAINIDWYNPKIAHKYTERQVKLLIKNSNAKLLRMDTKEQSGISFMIQNEKTKTDTT